MCGLAFDVLKEHGSRYRFILTTWMLSMPLPEALAAVTSPRGTFHNLWRVVAETKTSTFIRITNATSSHLARQERGRGVQTELLDTTRAEQRGVYGKSEQIEQDGANECKARIQAAHFLRG